MSIACSICPSKFTFNKNLYQHMRNKHKITPQVPGKIICPLQCEEIFRYYKELQEHLITFHKQPLEKEFRKFKDFQAFETWKKKLEDTTGYGYVRRICEKKLRSGEAKSHYICHRSGVYKSSSTGQRKLKKVGSNKIGAVCPSLMEVCRVLADDTVKVVYWKTHLGHKADYLKVPIWRKSNVRTNKDMVSFDVCVVLPAAGCGERMGMDTPKQFINIHNKPLICYTVEAFLKIPFIKKVVVVAASQNLEFMLTTMSQRCELQGDKLMVTEGSNTRHKSIQSGLRALQTCCENKPEVVVIHDGVRPFVSEEDVHKVVLAAKEHGAAGITCPLVSTVISVDDKGFLDSSLDRSKYKASEMPQAFQYDLLWKAYGTCSVYDLEHGTECLHLIQKYANVKAKLLPGASYLWKVTHHKDIYTATAVVKENQSVGIINCNSSPTLLPFLKTSLSKTFKSVHCAGKLIECLNKYQNVVQMSDHGHLYSVIEQMSTVSQGKVLSQQTTVVHIFLNGFDNTINILEFQKEAKLKAKSLKEANILVYFILVEDSESSNSLEQLSELASSLLFDSNPNISGSVFFS